MKTIETKIETITPVKAEAWLRKNENNRPLSKNVVDRFVHALKQGHWQTTHQGLAFNGDGRLLDGQHRLTAIVKSGVSAEMMVTRGLSDEAFTVIDTGAARTAAHHFAMMGYKNATVLSGALQLQYRFDKSGGDLGTALPASKRPDKDDLVRTASISPRLVELTQDSSSTGIPMFARNTRLLISPPWLTVLVYQIEQYDSELCDVFFCSLINGAGLKETSIVLKTRERLLKMTNEILAKRRSGGEITSIAKAALIVKAWNAVRTGKEHGKQSVMMWRAHGPGAESFPLIV